MNNKEYTVLAKLVEKQCDRENYTTLVFKILDLDDLNREEFISPYIMCVMFPNWNHEEINLGDEGYLKFKEVIAGVDKWFDGHSTNYYRYSDNIFIKFIKIGRPEPKEIIL